MMASLLARLLLALPIFTLHNKVIYLMLNNIKKKPWIKLHSLGLLKINIIISMIFLTTGCTLLTPSSEKLKNIFDYTTSNYAEHALNLNISTTPDLNSYHNQSNSCSLFVIQSEDRAVLSKLINDTNMLQHLFNGEQKVNDVLQINQFTLMPNRIFSSTLPRAERAKYIAILAGYYPAPGPDYSFVVELPMKLQKQGLLFPDYSANYEPLDITLKLGRLNFIQAEFKPVGDQYTLLKRETSKNSGASTFSMMEKSYLDNISSIKEKINNGNEGTTK